MSQNNKMNEIGGYEYQKKEAEKIIDFFKNYETYTKNGASLPRGIVFYGSPGNGKTMFANAIAKDSGVKVFNIVNTSENGGETSLSYELITTFRRAREEAPCVVILDEIDQIIDCSESFAASPSDLEKANLRILLTEIDNLENSGVFVIATGNVDIDELPAALVRNGRIEKHIYIGDPDFKDRVDILEMYLKRSPEIFENIKAVEIAKLTQGFTCASLKSLVNDVLIKCLSSNHKKAEYQDFHEPIQIIISHGIKRKTPKNIDHTVYHEIGHLVVDYVLNNRVGFVTVESFGSAAGFYKGNLRLVRIPLSGLDDEDMEAPQTLADFNRKNTVSIAGLVATELFMGERYVGAYSDLMNIKNSYDAMCTNGLLTFEEFAKALPDHSPNPFAKETPKTNQRLLSDYLNELYASAKEILEKHRPLVQTFFTELKAKKTLTSEEVAAIIENCNYTTD